MADTRLIGVRKKNKDIWLDKARVLNQINKIDISLLALLNYHDDRTDIGCQPKQKSNSSIEYRTYHQSQRILNFLNQSLKPES